VRRHVDVNADHVNRMLPARMHASSYTAIFKVLPRQHLGSEYLVANGS
jgi:hypothetical protein